MYLVVSPVRFVRQKCSDTPCGCQAPPQNSNWTDYYVFVCVFYKATYVTLRDALKETNTKGLSRVFTDSPTFHLMPCGRQVPPCDHYTHYTCYTYYSEPPRLKLCSLAATCRCWYQAL